MSQLPASLLKSFKTLSTEAKELYLRHEIAEIQKTPTSVEFLRDWVSPNMPVLIKGGISHWPALVRWKLSYFRETLASKSFMVAVTPNGYADAITSHNGTEYFVTPAEVPMTMLQLIEALEKPVPGRICYLQSQNSNLTRDFPELLHDIDSDIPWATEAFGNQPDAVNIWIGDSRAVTSMHKDPYENLYCVVSGYKDFLLHAPTDRPWLLHKNYPQATYKELVPGYEVLAEMPLDPALEESVVIYFHEASSSTIWDGWSPSALKNPIHPALCAPNEDEVAGASVEKATPSQPSVVPLNAASSKDHSRKRKRNTSTSSETRHLYNTLAEEKRELVALQRQVVEEELAKAREERMFRREEHEKKMKLMDEEHAKRMVILDLDKLLKEKTLASFSQR